MGGSLEQAKGVYVYFSNHCFESEAIINDLPSEPTMSRSVSDEGNYFKAVAASQKQIRGPHPDILFIDEACETKDELILSALPMVNTSPNQLVVMTSTFHKIFGLFQETWDKAEEQGYCRLSWDIFDVTKKFDESIWDDPEYVRTIPDLAELKKRAKGRTGDEEGWIPVTNIVQAWREKTTVDWFDVEYMGSRPSAAGMINDPEDVDACTIDDVGPYAHVEGAEVVGGLDWGYASMTSWVAFMSHANGVKVQVANRNWSQVDDATIIEQIVEDVIKFNIQYIRADSAGTFSNKSLQKALNTALAPLGRKCIVIEMVFGKDKVNMLGNYRVYFQNRKLIIPRTFAVAIWQHKRYRFEANSDKPMKKDDHVPDATMCCLYHWPLGRNVPIFIAKPTNERKAPRDNKFIDARVEVAEPIDRSHEDEFPLSSGLRDDDL